MQVLTYHGTIGRRERADHFAPLFTDLDEFAKQIAFLTRRYPLVSLAEIRRHLTAGQPLPADAVHVSFDDGFRNTLAAAEVLHEHRVPWSMFVIVDAVLDGYVPWFVRLAEAVEATSRVRLRDGSVCDLTARREKRRFREVATSHVMAAPASRANTVVDEILSLPGMRVPEQPRWPFLTVGELRQLQQAGAEIGNHSARHYNLARCSAPELGTEVRESRTRLESALLEPVRAFAYPHGRHRRAVRRAVAADHDVAFAVWTYRPARSRWAMLRADAGPDLHSLRAALSSYYRLGYGVRRLRWATGPRANEMLYRLRPRR